METENTAAIRAYVAAMNKAGNLLAALTQFVDDMGDLSPEDVDWAHVGDARRLVADLTAITEYTLAKEPADA